MTIMLFTPKATGKFGNSFSRIQIEYDCPLNITYLKISWSSEGMISLHLKYGVKERVLILAYELLAAQISYACLSLI